MINEQEGKFLSEAEMLKMENFQLEIRSHDLKAQNTQKDVLILELQKQILALKTEKLTQQISDCKKKISDETSKKEEVRKQSKDFNSHIATKYELNESWGYNPETGKLIQED